MNRFQRNREELYARLEDRSVCILYSGALKQVSADENYPFKVNMNFYYLTGIRQDNVYLVIRKFFRQVEETLYVYENDPDKVRWIGAYLYRDEAEAISGVKDVRYLDRLDGDLNRLLSLKSIRKVYLDLEKPPFEGQVNFGFVLKNKVQAIDFNKTVEDVYPKIVALRGVKKADEIALYREDVRITDLALQEVMKRLSNLEYEYQVQAVFEGAIRFFGNANPSFDTIAASGKNAAILHYRSNSAKMNRSDMILLDLGAENNLYHADISRTYPLSGKFNPLQKKIYQIVLDCNKHILSLIRPGNTIRNLQNETVRFLAEACLNAGLIKESEEIHRYYFHGISHHIGLDTHDPYPRYATTLVPGMIISCEPGLYFEELGIGVRIEDDILVTEDGCENLSSGIIKEVDEIENFMAAHHI